MPNFVEIASTVAEISRFFDIIIVRMMRAKEDIIHKTEV